MQVKYAVFMPLVFAVLCAQPVLAQNFVILGSNQAPIKYIRGAGSNLGLYVGVEYKPENATLGKLHRGEIGICRSFRTGGLKGTGQGFGKPLISDPHAHDTGAAVSTPKPLLNQAARQTLRLPSSISDFISQDLPYFQLKPVYEFEIDSDRVTEVLLPLLCQDQFLDVPPDMQQENFDTFTLSDTVTQAYAGIYRLDKYIDANIISKILYDGEGSFILLGSLSPIEVQTIVLSHIEVDSSTLGEVEPGFYNVSHAHLHPAWANWPIWAARHNQDTTDCKRGIEHIIGEPPSRDLIDAIFYLNHIVFYMAEMDVFRNRFPNPGGPTPQIPNCAPNALIQWNPKLFEMQNDANGVVFTGEHSFDPDGEIQSYHWSFGTGDISEQINPTYKFSAPSSFEVVLTVTDNLGTVDRDTVSVVISSVNEHEGNLPSEFELLQNFPNPFNNSTAITYEVLRSEFVTVRIYDVSGREVISLVNGRRASGRYQVLWNGKDEFGRDVTAGLYFYRVTTSRLDLVRRMVLLLTTGHGRDTGQRSQRLRRRETTASHESRKRSLATYGG